MFRKTIAIAAATAASIAVAAPSAHATINGNLQITDMTSATPSAGAQTSKAAGDMGWNVAPNRKL